MPNSTQVYQGITALQNLDTVGHFIQPPVVVVQESPIHDDQPYFPCDLTLVHNNDDTYFQSFANSCEAH